MELATLKLRESISSTSSEDYRTTGNSMFTTVKDYCTSTRRTCCQLFVASLLISVTVFAVCVLTIPTITYIHYELTTDPQSSNTAALNSTMTSNNNTCPQYGPRNHSSCQPTMSWSHFPSTNNTTSHCQVLTSTVIGSMDLCLPYLTSWHQCSIGTSDVMYVSERTAIASTTRDKISQLLFYKNSASLVCQSALLPFICQLSFPLCSCANGDLYLPSRENCLTISTDVCAREWSVVSSIDSTVLPNCQLLPTETSFNQSSITNNSNSSVSSSFTSTANNTNDTSCSKNFYKSNSTCLPNCYTFDNDRHVLIGQLVTSSIAIFGSIIVAVIALVQWRQTLKFPAVIQLYITFACFLFGLINILSQLDWNGLYCTSMNLIEAINNPSTFCKASGFTVTFSLLSIFAWSFISLLFVFYKAMIPSWRKDKWIKYDKYIHIIFVISCLLYPFTVSLLPALISDWEYTMLTFPTTHCTTKSIHYWYYAVILPLCVSLGLAVCMCMGLVWKWHHNWIYSKEMTVQSNDKKSLLLYGYIALLETILLIQTVIYTTSSTSYSERLMEYFVCELFGHEESETSSCTPHDNTGYTLPLLFYYLLLSLIPVLIFIGLFNWREKLSRTAATLRKKYKQ